MMVADRDDGDGDGGTPPTSPLDRRAAPWLVLWGLTVWAAVAVSIRLGGGRLLSPATPGVLLGFFAAVVPLMAAVTYPVYRRLDVPPAARATAAALMSLPGMLLDVLLVLFADAAFPALGTGAAVNFGAILLFGYAVVLATGFVPVGWPAQSDGSGSSPGP
jgi:hypothetical protein